MSNADPLAGGSASRNVARPRRCSLAWCTGHGLRVNMPAGMRRLLEVGCGGPMDQWLAAIVFAVVALAITREILRK